MNTTVRKNVINSFLTTVKPEVDSIPSMILKLRDSKMFSPLPTWMIDYEIPSGTIASELPATTCLFRLNECRRKDTKITHPVHAIELLSLENDVSITPTNVIVHSKEKQDLKVIRSVVTTGNATEDSYIIAAAVTSSLVASEVVCTNKGVTPLVWPEDNAMENMDLRYIRTRLGCKEISPTANRDKLYEILSGDKVVTAMAHTQAGAKLKNYVPHADMSEDVTMIAQARGDIKKTDKIDVSIVTMDKSKLLFTNKLDDAYLLWGRNNSVRGGEGSSRGILSSSYFLFDTTRSIAHKYRTVKDLMNMMHKVGTKILRTQSANLNREEMRWLVANGVRIVCDREEFPAYEDKPGVYGSMPNGKKKSVVSLRFVSFSTHEMMPVIGSDTVTFPNISRITNAVKVLVNCSEPTVAYLPLSVVLKSEQIKLYPSCDPATMMVLVGTCINGGYALEDHIRRCSAGVICRSRFLRTRAPFWIYDSMTDFMNYEKAIIIPKLYVTKEKKVMAISEFEYKEYDTEDVLDYKRVQIPVAAAIQQERTYIQYYVDFVVSAENLEKLRNETYFLNDYEYDGEVSEQARALYSDAANGPSRMDIVYDLNANLYVTMMGFIDERDQELGDPASENENDNDHVPVGNEEIGVDNRSRRTISLFTDDNN